MTMTLLINDEKRAAVDAIVAAAMRDWTTPEAACDLGDFRTKFCVIHDDDSRGGMRHLVIATPTQPIGTAYPTMGVVKAIARLFGFVDPYTTDRFPETWRIILRDDGPLEDRCIILGERFEVTP